MNKILITGSNGFIGSHLTREILFKTNYEIRAMVLKGTSEESIRNIIDEFETDNPERSASKRIKIIYADLLNKKTLEAACENIDVVVHLAGLVSEWGPKDAFFSLIVEGTQKLLDAASDNNVKRFIYMSSLTVHDLNGHYYNDENTPRDMEFFPYGVAKKKAEDLVTAWGSKGNQRDYALIRPGFIIYGPGDKNSFIRALDSMIEGQFGFINGGKSLISFVYVENLVYGIRLLVQADSIDGPYIILDGNKTWKEFVQVWVNRVGHKMPIANVPFIVLFPFIWILENLYKLFNVKKPPILTLYSIRIPRKHLAFTSDKIKKELGYKPVVPFQETIKLTLEYLADEYSKDIDIKI
ncbi:MAG: NAD-dependent epimerase/dehydratase family protein [Candidatus Lokiarchaeota archaeon]|nr:NAD-dependent epimerase/dehydratase family protein [Candidatus Lokiarchaeota archaeon]